MALAPQPSSRVPEPTHFAREFPSVKERVSRVQGFRPTPRRKEVFVSSIPPLHVESHRLSKTQCTQEFLLSLHGTAANC